MASTNASALNSISIAIAKVRSAIVPCRYASSAFDCFSAAVGTWIPERTFAMAMLLLFSALALVLAMAGVYALIAYSTALRSQEFGVRLTLGASPRELVGTVLRQAAAIGARGVTIGLALTFALARFVTTLLFGLTAYDSRSYVFATLGVIVTVIAAGALPAWRAARLDPVRTLRTE